MSLIYCYRHNGFIQNHRTVFHFCQWTTNSSCRQCTRLMNYSVGTALLTVSYDVFSHIGAERRQSLKSLTAETVDEMSTDESCFIDSRTDPRGVTSAHIQFLRVIALSTKKHSTERIRHILPFRLRTVSRTRISGLGSGPVPKALDTEHFTHIRPLWGDFLLAYEHKHK